MTMAIAVRRRRTVGVVLAGLSLALAAACVVFQFTGVTGAGGYTMQLRVRQLVALLVVGASVGASTVVFQTIAGNRILTPGVIGFDSLFVLVQTVLVWAFGSEVLTAVPVWGRFFLNMLLMVAFGVALFRWLFRRGSRDLYALMLIGVVLGTLFASLASFASRLLDPTEYLTLQDLLFASFTNVNEQLLVAVTLVSLGGLAALAALLPRLDVAALGHDRAVSVGLDHHRTVTATLVIVCVLVSAATALVGPMMFLGLIVASLARLLPTGRHRDLAPAAALIGMLMMVVAQYAVSRVFAFTTTVSVIVNMVGGVCFILLILREARR